MEANKIQVDVQVPQHLLPFWNVVVCPSVMKTTASHWASQP